MPYWNPTPSEKRYDRKFIPPPLLPPGTMFPVKEIYKGFYALQRALESNQQFWYCDLKPQELIKLDETTRSQQWLTLVTKSDLLAGYYYIIETRYDFLHKMSTVRTFHV